MTVESANKGATVAAITSPWWLPLLHSISELAALVLPILGVVWLAVQIGIKVHTTYWRKTKEVE